MNRIDRRFAELADAGRAGLITFVTAGDPDPALTTDLLHALAAHGADLIELGMPFSDPMADGPVIQHANERALAKGVGLAQVLQAVADFRRQDATTPLILMGYLNPIERYGFEAFANAASAAGVDGMLLVDCPPEESSTYATTLKRLDLKQIFLVAPTTPAARRSVIAQSASGFLYYVSFKGITGAAHAEQDQAIGALEELRTMTSTPIAVGFGIKTAADACRFGAHADAVVIGSALVEHLSGASDGDDLRARVAAFLEPIRVALANLGRVAA